MRVRVAQGLVSSVASHWDAAVAAVEAERGRRQTALEAALDEAETDLAAEDLAAAGALGVDEGSCVSPAAGAAGAAGASGDGSGGSSRSSSGGGSNSSGGSSSSSGGRGSSMGLGLGVGGVQYRELPDLRRTVGRVFENAVRGTEGLC